MESENKNLLQKNIDLKDVNLATAAARRKYNKLILVFKFFFFALTLIIGALIIYLVRQIASDSESDRSIHLNYPSDQTLNNLPTVDIQSQIFDTQRAAEELEDVLKYLASNTDAASQIALKTCRKSLLNGSGQIRRALEMNRVIAMNQIRACVDDLEKVESTAGDEVRGKVVGVKMYLREWGGFVDESIWRKKVSSTIAANWALVMENLLFLVCVGGLQLSFIIYMVWAFVKFG